VSRLSFLARFVVKRDCDYSLKAYLPDNVLKVAAESALRIDAVFNSVLVVVDFKGIHCYSRLIVCAMISGVYFSPPYWSA